jgi:hypothetical protein
MFLLKYEECGASNLPTWNKRYEKKNRTDSEG